MSVFQQTGPKQALLGVFDVDKPALWNVWKGIESMSSSGLAYSSYKYGNWQRVSRRQPCPICGKRDFCEIARDGQTVHCMRIASDKPTQYRQGGWLHNLFPVSETINTRPQIRQVVTQPATEIKLAALETRHWCIKYLLEQLELNQAHRDYLWKEGFSAEQALELGYRTLPQNGREVLAREVAQLAGHEAGQLAFLYEKRGKAGSRYFQFAVARPEVLLIPIRDISGAYAGLKARWVSYDENGQAVRHYRIMSAGSSGGASLGTPLHVARHARNSNQKRVIVTEGEKKADYIALRSGLTVVGVQGTGNWRAGGGERHLVAALEQLGAQEVEIAFDADMENNPRVARDLYQMACQVQAAGFEVLIRRWPLNVAKGYDDLLRLGLADKSFVERFSPEVSPVTKSWVKKFIELDAETLQSQLSRNGVGIHALYTVEEARQQHAKVFQELFNGHFFSLGRESKTLVVTSNPGTGKTHAALAAALEATKNFPQGRILYLADNKEVYRQWIEPGALLHGAFGAGTVAVREGRQRKAGSFECRNYDSCEMAGRQRHAPAWDVCARCPFYSEANWKKHQQEYDLGETEMPWNCRQQGYWHGVEHAERARLVLAPKASFFNNSQELARYDVIIIDESAVEPLLEKVSLRPETLAEWREAIMRQAGQDYGWQQNFAPFLRLFELIEISLADFTQQIINEERSRRQLWSFLPTLQKVAAATGVDLSSLLSECRMIPTSQQTGRYPWEQPFQKLDGSLTFPLHFARELIEALSNEIEVTASGDSRLWFSREDKNAALTVYLPRTNLLKILQGAENISYQNQFGLRPSVVLLDATPSPLLKYVLGESYETAHFEVAQHVEVTQLTNSLYTKDELVARGGKALQEVSRLLGREAGKYSSAAIFSHKTFNPTLPGDAAYKLQATTPQTQLTWGHFDRDNKALNSLRDVEMIAIVGHYCHPLDQLRAQVQAFRFEQKADKPEVINAQTPTLKLRVYNWRNNNGRGMARRCRADFDNEVQASIEHCERAAILQAIGRGRPTLRSPEKPLRVLLVSGMPLGTALPVQRLAEAKEMLGENVITLAQTQALAHGRSLKLARNKAKRSEVFERLEKALNQFAAEKLNGREGYVQPKELGQRAAVNRWQLNLSGLDKFLLLGDENKTFIGPELYIYSMKPFRYTNSFVSSVSSSISDRKNQHSWQKLTEEPPFLL